jgi:hypothetical protein
MYMRFGTRLRLASGVVLLLTLASAACTSLLDLRDDYVLASDGSAGGDAPSSDGQSQADAAIKDAGHEAASFSEAGVDASVH